MPKNSTVDDFDPDAFLAQTDEFDPDAFLAEAEQAPSMAESGVRGAISGLTWGAAPYIAGAVEGALTDKTIEQATSESKAAFEEAEKANPGSFLTGEVLGGVASSGGAGFLGRKALMAGGKKALSLASKVGDIGLDPTAMAIDLATGSGGMATGASIAKKIATRALDSMSKSKGLKEIAKASGKPLSEVQAMATKLAPKSSTENLLARVTKAIEKEKAGPKVPKIPNSQAAVAKKSAEQEGVPLDQAMSTVQKAAAEAKDLAAQRKVSSLIGEPVQGPALPSAAESLASTISKRTGTDFQAALPKASDYLARKGSAAEAAKVAAVGRPSRVAEVAKVSEDEALTGMGMVRPLKKPNPSAKKLRLCVNS